MKNLIHRFGLVFGLALIFSALLALMIAPRPLAQAEVIKEPSAQQVAAARPTPAPLNPPIINPESGVEHAQPPSADRTVGGLEVAPFRPQFIVKRGEVPDFITAKSVEDKPVPGRPAEAQVMAPGNSPPLDFSPMLAPDSGWTLLAYETFEGAFPTGLWQRYGESGYESGYLWDDTNYGYQYGSWSGWPGACTGPLGGGQICLDPSQGYTNSMNSWMTYGPIDLTGKSDFFVGFGLWHYMEPNFDYAYFCASVDNISYYCSDSWTDWSNGWQNKAYWLTDYAGYSQVWVAWIFQSDSSIAGEVGYLGPYIDEISLWDYVPPAPDPGGQLLQNGSFETGDFTAWITDSVPVDPVYQPEVVNYTYVEGIYAAHLWRGTDGNNFLYQNFAVTPGMDSLTINYWYALTTIEVTPNQDYFCASVRPQSNLATITMDLGCIDAVNTISTTGSTWQQVTFTPNASQLSALKSAQDVALVFEHYDNGFGGNPNSNWTDLYVDYVRVYATSAGTALDPNEPNYDSTTATLVSCGITDTYGVIGDALGGYDIDWFRVDSVPSGPLVIDINARTRAPASLLDSVVYLYDQSLNVVAYNDDDGATYDSFISYTNPISGSTYYFSIQPYSGYGGPDYFYYFNVGCNSNAAPPGGGGEITPAPNTWTVMLYLNAEDPNFEQTLINYRQDIEAFIGAKSNFLTVTVQYDGPVTPTVGSSGTTRYIVQPNGVYMDSGTGQNRFNRGEENMGNPATLQDFVEWSMTQFPAENYYLAIDDHGDGAYGISVDGASGNDVLTPPEIYSALKGATHNGARPIDIVDFEACLMGLAENAYDIREWADYVVFSQQISWGINTYPVYFADLIATDTPLLVGQRIIQRYSAGATAASMPHTISLVDTSQLSNTLPVALNNFATALQNANNINATLLARHNTQAFAADVREATNPDFADYIDLWDFAAEVKRSPSFAGNATLNAAATAVQNVVNSAIIAEQHVSGGIQFGFTTYAWNHADAHGLSVYFPPDQGSPALANYISTAPYLYQITQDSTWDEFLQWAVPPVPGGGGGGRGGMSSTRVQSRLSSGVTYINISLYLPLMRR